MWIFPHEEEQRVQIYFGLDRCQTIVNGSFLLERKIHAWTYTAKNIKKNVVFNDLATKVLIYSLSNYSKWLFISS